MVEQIEHATTWISGLIWPVFLPFLLAISTYASFRVVFIIRPRLEPTPVRLKNVIGPVAIALSAMVGCGATVGVLKGLNKVVNLGQVYFEALPFWAVLSALILVPLAYSETIVAKITNSTPKKYLAITIGKFAGLLFTVAFLLAYVFAFAGIQFSGVDAAINVVNNNFFNIYLDTNERYFYIVIPMIIFVMAIVITKMHDLFIGSLAFLIGFATVSYCLFFTVFVFSTLDYLPIYFGRMLHGITQPVNMLGSVPVALVIGTQRLIQTAETGLGALGMSSLEAKSKPREAGVIAMVPAAITVFVAVCITSYIASYGVHKGLINFLPDTTAIERLTAYINTATYVTGTFGLMVMLIFVTLSGLSTILASYYFLDRLLPFSINTKIFFYFIFMLIAGTLAVFGFTIVFDTLDLCMFVITALNAIGISIFVTSQYKNYPAVTVLSKTK